jgi:hypothetical protein
MCASESLEVKKDHVPIAVIINAVRVTPHPDALCPIRALLGKLTAFRLTNSGGVDRIRNFKLSAGKED